MLLPPPRVCHSLPPAGPPHVLELGVRLVLPAGCASKLRLPGESGHYRAPAPKTALTIRAGRVLFVRPQSSPLAFPACSRAAALGSYQPVC